MLDGFAQGAEFAAIVRGFVERETKPLRDEIDQLRAQLALQEKLPDLAMVDERVAHAVREAVAALPAPEPALPAEVDMAEVARLVADEVAKIPAAKDGADADPEVVRGMVAEAVAALPPAEPGAPGVVDMAEVARLVAEEVAKIPAPENGKDADPDTVRAMVADAVAEAVAALPPAEPGAPGVVDMAEVERMLTERVGAWPKPRDGKDFDAMVLVDTVNLAVAKAVPLAVAELPDPVGVAGAIIDRDGQLVLTLSNGTQRELGRVVGRDVTEDQVLQMVRAAVDAIPRPKDGRDGLEPDQILMSWGEDGRTPTFKFVYGETAMVVEAQGEMGSFVVDRGVFQDGDKYQKGDGATYAGSYWIAKRETAAKPGEGSEDWRLAVKRGRDATARVQVSAPRKPPQVRLDGTST